jgi:hypothetical protein
MVSSLIKLTSLSTENWQTVTSGKGLLGFSFWGLIVATKTMSKSVWKILRSPLVLLGVSAILLLLVGRGYASTVEMVDELIGFVHVLIGAHLFVSRGT